ncbi:hypothetical protein HDU96_009319 [Phlyctochytrium bullatum]|nr:hypothetical protein HDU96_009319 [Phlyctochytrium bullatum]
MATAAAAYGDTTMEDHTRPLDIHDDQDEDSLLDDYYYQDDTEEAVQQDKDILPPPALDSARAPVPPTPTPQEKTRNIQQVVENLLLELEGTLRTTSLSSPLPPADPASPSSTPVKRASRPPTTDPLPSALQTLINASKTGVPTTPPAAAATPDDDQEDTMTPLEALALIQEELKRGQRQMAALKSAARRRVAGSGTPAKRSSSTDDANPLTPVNMSRSKSNASSFAASSNGSDLPSKPPPTGALPAVPASAPTPLPVPPTPTPLPAAASTFMAAQLQQQMMLQAQLQHQQLQQQAQAQQQQYLSAVAASANPALYTALLQDYYYKLYSIAAGMQPTQIPKPPGVGSMPPPASPLPPSLHHHQHQHPTPPTSPQATSLSYAAFSSPTSLKTSPPMGPTDHPMDPVPPRSVHAAVAAAGTSPTNSSTPSSPTVHNDAAGPYTPHPPLDRRPSLAPTASTVRTTVAHPNHPGPPPPLPGPHRGAYPPHLADASDAASLAFSFQGSSVASSSAYYGYPHGVPPPPPPGTTAPTPAAPVDPAPADAAPPAAAPTKKLTWSDDADRPPRADDASSTSSSTGTGDKKPAPAPAPASSIRSRSFFLFGGGPKDKEEKKVGGVAAPYGGPMPPSLEEMEREAAKTVGSGKGAAAAGKPAQAQAKGSVKKRTVPPPMVEGAFGLLPSRLVGE